MLDLLATAWRLLLIVVIYAFLWRLSLEVIRGSVPDGAQQVASLVVISTPGDPPAGTRFRLEDMVTIGRGPENDIVVKDAFASWHHAEVYRRGTRIFVEDLNSKNGTLVNGRRIKKRTALKMGDQLSIGDTVFECRE